MKSNKMLKHDIARDRILAAVRWKRWRRRSLVGVTTGFILFSAALQIRNLPQGPLEVENPKTSVESITDKELLAALYDQGPVLVRFADGSQRLFVTEPKQIRTDRRFRR